MDLVVVVVGGGAGANDERPGKRLLSHSNLTPLSNSEKTFYRFVSI